MAHHVHRATGLGAWVLINENWYYVAAAANFRKRLVAVIEALD